MDFNFAYNKPSSFFKGKTAIALLDIETYPGKIPAGTEVTIIKKSDGLKSSFELETKERVRISRVGYDFLALIISFKELKDGKVWMYVPELKAVYKMDVAKLPDGTFQISNYGRKGGIQGHEYAAVISSQEDLDNFFYIEYGNLTPDSIKAAELKFQQNGKNWIF